MPGVGEAETGKTGVSARKNRTRSISQERSSSGAGAGGDKAGEYRGRTEENCKETKNTKGWSKSRVVAGGRGREAREKERLELVGVLVQRVRDRQAQTQTTYNNRLGRELTLASPTP
jgi:hypothetical protein